MIRHHRLLELYLAETLGLHVDDVHDEADRLEHVISEELEARIDRALGFPTHDPHGDPIPDANLNWPAEQTRPPGVNSALIPPWGSGKQSAERSRSCRIRSSAEDRIAQYVIREHHRGRPLAEILEDHYVTNRCSPEQIARILERNDVIHAVGDDIIAVGAHRDVELASARARRRAQRRRCPRPRARST